MEKINLKRLIRLGDILNQFDKHHLFQVLKLKGTSAIQMLFFNRNQNIKPFLEFDFHVTGIAENLNELRKRMIEDLPHLLTQKNFELLVKESKITATFDNYKVKDLLTNEVYEIHIDYLNREHILKPEFYARKDDFFEDLHMHSLSLLENYGIFIVDYLLGKTDMNAIKFLIDENKILPQQYPFLRKIVLFYLVLEGYLDYEPTIKQEDSYQILLDALFEYNEKEISFIEGLKVLEVRTKDLFPGMIGEKLSKHPKLLWRIKNKEWKNA